MRKLILGLLLAATSAPAYSMFIYEVRGFANVYEYEFTQNGYVERPVATGAFLLKGPCQEFYCYVSGSGNTTTLSASSYHVGGFTLTYTLGAPIIGTPGEPPWYSVTGYGELYSGYIQGGRWVMLPRSARGYDDGLGWSNDKVPTIYFTRLPAPEPATWAMMIGGFALAGSLMRRQKLAISIA